VSRSRSFRRLQAERAKSRARWLWTDIWQVKDYSRGAGYSPCEPNPIWVGRMAQTHCKPCSCPGCGNARRHFGRRSRQELRAALDDRWLLHPAAWRQGPPLELEFDALHLGPAPYPGFLEPGRSSSNHPLGFYSVL
jgi:hypothetical protein